MMKLRTIKYAVPLTAIMTSIALLSSGCSQGVSPIAKSSKPLPLSAAWVTAGAGNSANIDDSIGYYHNLGLDYIAANNLSDPNPSISGTVGFVISQGWLSSDSAASLAARLTSFGINPTQVWDTTSPSSLFLSYLTILDTLVDTSTSPSTLISGVKIIEGEIMTSTMSLSEQPFLLRYTSILRYSTAYWSGPDRWKWPSTSYDSTWDVSRVDQKRGFTPQRIDPIRIKKIFVADATGSLFGALGGFVGGAFTGALGGLLLGGPPGGLAGAAGGAIAGSVDGALSGGIATSVGAVVTGP